MDNIILMDSGILVDTGTDKELSEKNKLYKEIS